MSSPGRVFETARDKVVLEDDTPKHQKQGRKHSRKPFGIQIKYGVGSWHNWKWYETDVKRDQAFADLIRKGPPYGMDIKYRKVEKCQQL